MITIQTVHNIRRGARITFWNGIYAILLGILSLVFMNPLIKMNFRNINVVWQVFSKYNPEIASFFIKMLILKGVFVILMGVIILSLSEYILKKKDKTAWVLLFTIGLIFWASLLTIEILSKNVYSISASLVGWVFFIIGMLLPIKYYLQGEENSY